MRSLTFFTVIILFYSCSRKNDAGKEEQITLKDTLTVINDSAVANTIRGNISFNQIASTPHSVILTGLQEHRLITVYKIKPERKSTTVDYGSAGNSYSEENINEQGYNKHFMPGLDLIYGYNLLNVAHYDLSIERLNFLFDHPVLIKSLYYPSFAQDSLDKKPINRNYYLVSVYDADTNGDTLINKFDLRRFYFFNYAASERIQLVPEDYSVIRSQYDPTNDVMYVFACHDVNRNGKTDKKEPVHIFWFSLKQPAKAKRLY